MKFRIPNENTSLKFDLTPLVDVVFQLLFFFMLTGYFGEANSALVVDLPETASAKEGAKAHAVVTITPDNKMWMGGASYAKPQLIEKLREEKEKERLIINGDRRARLGVLVDVWDAARLAGFHHVNVASEPEKERTSS